MWLSVLDSMELLIIPFGTTAPRKEKNKQDMPFILYKLNKNNALKMGTK
jgi:hypothetical protein